MSKEDGLCDDFFVQVMASDVVEVRCERCGSQTIMNKQYARYVTNGTIKDCGKCRNMPSFSRKQD
jgi:ribosomal protein S27AE